MTGLARVPAEVEARLVAHQIGRVPREPWRVAVRCQWERPSVIASPSRLEDGSRFPTLYWLTCPWLIGHASALESEGVLADWYDRTASDPALGAALEAAERALIERRAEESGGEDACSDAGIAGQRRSAVVKCLHAHVALALAGIADPVGRETLALVGEACDDDACGDVLAALDDSATGVAAAAHAEM